MNPSLRVALVGFSSFERSTFEAFFRLSTRRTPAYEYCDDLNRCHIAVADGDKPSVVAAVVAAGKLGQALIIGADACPGAAMHLRRPINLMAVTRLLDQMHGTLAQATAAAVHPDGLPATPPSAARPEPAASPAKPQPQPQSNVQVVLDVLAKTQRPRAVPTAAAAPAEQPAVPARPLPPTPPAISPAPAAPVNPDSPALPGMTAMDHILVVDDSDIALRFMAGRLERFGFVVHLSRSGEDALARTEQQFFSFVFMDVTMPGLDGFKTCKAIKRRAYGTDEQPPTVIMLTSRDTPVDKLRGTMAGCDGYLTKPLDENELLKIIGDREIERHEFAVTAQAARHA